MSSSSSASAPQFCGQVTDVSVVHPMDGSDSYAHGSIECADTRIYVRLSNLFNGDYVVYNGTVDEQDNVQAWNVQRLCEMQFHGKITDLNEQCGWISCADTYAFLRRSVYVQSCEVKNAQCSDEVEFGLKMENNQLQATCVNVTSSGVDGHAATSADAVADVESTMVPSDTSSVGSTDGSHQPAASTAFRKDRIEANGCNVPYETAGTTPSGDWAGFTPFETPVVFHPFYNFAGSAPSNQASEWAW